MRTRKQIILMTLSLLIIIVHAYGLFAQEDEKTIYDKDINVISFEEMRYPPIARQARIQGDVVVLVKIDSGGRVTSANAISGAKLLIADTLSNAKKWHFRPNAGQAAIIVYDFRIAEGTCNSSEQNHISAFREPNILVVIACGEIWQP
jgi:TonB family protein